MTGRLSMFPLFGNRWIKCVLQHLGREGTSMYLLNRLKLTGTLANYSVLEVYKVAIVARGCIILYKIIYSGTMNAISPLPSNYPWIPQAFPCCSDIRK